jgi:hypothetical protein
MDVSGTGNIFMCPVYIGSGAGLVESEIPGEVQVQNAGFRKIFIRKGACFYIAA